MRLPSLLVIAAAFTASATAAPTAVAAGPRFSIRPVTYDPAVPATQSYFIFDTEPGTVAHSALKVANVGDAPGTVLLYAVDATTGQTSGTVYRSRSARRVDVGAWLRLASSRLRLAAGETRVVPFEFSVPRHVRPGQHVGGIVAENATRPTAGTAGSQDAGSSFTIRFRFLSIVAVVVNLPGPMIEHVAVTGVSADHVPSYQRLRIRLHNKGNMLERPIATLTVTDSRGRRVLRRWIKLDTILPQTAIAYPIYLRRKRLAVGEYRASVQLRYGHNRRTHFTGSFRVGSR
jgi:hypothetical protein